MFPGALWGNVPAYASVEVRSCNCTFLAWAQHDVLINHGINFEVFSQQNLVKIDEQWE